MQKECPTTKKVFYWRNLLTIFNTVNKHRWNTDNLYVCHQNLTILAKYWEGNYASNSDGFLPMKVVVGGAFYYQSFVTVKCPSVIK